LALFLPLPHPQHSVSHLSHYFSLYLLFHYTFYLSLAITGMIIEAVGGLCYWEALLSRKRAQNCATCDSQLPRNNERTWSEAYTSADGSQFSFRVLSRAERGALLLQGMFNWRSLTVCGFYRLPLCTQ
jgi:hypothetical protein